VKGKSYTSTEKN